MGRGSCVVAPTSRCRSSARASARSPATRAQANGIQIVLKRSTACPAEMSDNYLFLPVFPEILEQRRGSLVALLELERWTGMTELSQLANAVVAVVFAAVLLVGGQWFIEHRAAKNPVMPGLAAATTRVAATR